MGRYKTLMLSGPYAKRQRAANEMEAVCYFEQHLSASNEGDSPGSCARVATARAGISELWGAHYADIVAACTSYQCRSAWPVLVGGQADESLGDLTMPAIIAEPCSITRPAAACRMISTTFLDLLALAAVASISERFPAGLIALSPGHGDIDGRDPRSWDPGELSPADPEVMPVQLSEAMVARAILARVKRILESM